MEAKENCAHCQGKRSSYDEKGKFHICLPDARKDILNHERGLRDPGVSRFVVVRFADKGILPGLKNPFTIIREIPREEIIKLIKGAKVIFHDDSGTPSS